MPKILASYAPLKRQDVTISINTLNWTLGSATNATLTATLADGTPYSGPAALSYDNASGATSCTFSNGAATVAITKANNLSNSAITVHIEQSSKVNKTAQTFTCTANDLSGQQIYVDNNTYIRQRAYYSSDGTNYSWGGWYNGYQVGSGGSGTAPSSWYSYMPTPYQGKTFRKGSRHHTEKESEDINVVYYYISMDA